MSGQIRRYAQVVAIQALREQKECKVVDYFLKVLESNDSGLRKKVIEQLGFFMAAKALDLLTSALSDEDPEIRRRAAESLGVMKDTRAADFLWSSFEKEPLERVRLSLAWALQQLGDRRVIPTIYPILLEELKDPDVMVRTGVLHYLAWIGDETAVELLRECSKKDEHHWVRLESQKQLEMIAKGTVEHSGISMDLYPLVEYRFLSPLLKDPLPENPDHKK